MTVATTAYWIVAANKCMSFALALDKAIDMATDMDTDMTSNTTATAGQHGGRWLCWSLPS